MKKAKYVVPLKGKTIRKTAKQIADDQMTRLLARIERIDKRVHRLESKGHDE
jgi:uncharacterized protein (UPF0335 family)